MRTDGAHTTAPVLQVTRWEPLGAENSAPSPSSRRADVQLGNSYVLIKSLFEEKDHVSVRKRGGRVLLQREISC